ncbi:SMP-30/gluconolactonase/LRE family protein [Plantibacter sp. CFBP 8775]|uniref:SMP-30/gluconolactonase/LRE family protein n=1 Tax=Plantibacter sp. CFBP 8775 TaxID=2774038 RepID=UPI001785D817|nr:SMP-30/gluconolactonase/LRE family protein [Plantibacter sp. CFBP 8775]MBD8102795.1 SMP-30/gluconolactonase/LRE family protein [Plantibacter sp. CFBP 8775]
MSADTALWRRRDVRVLGGLVLATTLAGCTTVTTTPAVSSTTGPSGASTITSTELLQVTSPHDLTGMTLLEGPTFGPDGDLYVVDVTAPPGEPKVLRIDTESLDVTPIHTDSTSAYTSAQFSPVDDRLYLTDFIGGRIDSITADGDDLRQFFAGDVDGAPIHPDDVSFDEAGHLYVSDSAGYDRPYWEASGRLIRLDGSTAEPSVLADGLAAPNGVAFTPGFDGLWVTHNTGNQVDFVRLDETGSRVVTAFPALHIDGGTTQVDSAAVDADGNLYLGLHGRAAVLVYSDTGEHLATVEMPHDEDGVGSATNVAIEPGTTDAYVTVSGEAGGYVYRFTALGEGIRQSNGG